MKFQTAQEIYEEALAIKEQEGEDWDSEDEEALEEIYACTQGDEEDLDPEEEEEEDPILGYQRRPKRQRSHSTSERRKAYRAKGPMGRIKAKQYQRKYKRKYKPQLNRTQGINSKKPRHRIGPKVKNRRRRRASEDLTHLDMARLERHGCYVL